MGRHVSDRSESPVRGRGSPRQRSPARRDRSPARIRSSHATKSPSRGNPSSRPRSPKRANSRSPVPRSPSPRTKRLKKAQSERLIEKANDREHGRNHNSGGDRAPQCEKGSEKEHLGDKRERGSDLSEKRERGSDKEHLSGKQERGSDKEHLSEKRERGSDKEHLSGKRDRGLDKEHLREKRDRGLDKEHLREKRDRGSDKEHLSEKRERGSEREVPSEKRERRPGRDAVDGGSSKMRHGRSISPVDRHQRTRRKSHSPDPASRNGALDEVTNTSGGDRGKGDDDSVAKMKAAEEALLTKEKEKPSFELSGKLAAETNRVRGVTLLFNEPPDARKPDIRWRLYVFKAGEVLSEPLYVHRQTCYLFGRERRVADIPTDHPSCSKQHAVLQYRQVEIENSDGTLKKQVKPYIMDLGSTNGTFINENRVEAERYYELFERDTIKFGNSSREYVLLHENSAT